MRNHGVGGSREGLQEGPRDRVERASRNEVRLQWGVLQDKDGFVGQIKQSWLPFVSGRAPKAFQLRNNLTRFVLFEFLMLWSPSSYFSLHGVRSVAQWCPTLLRPHGQYCSPLGSSMGFSRQEDWSGLPFPTPGDLPNPGNKPASPESPALAGRFFTTAPPGKPFSLHDQPITQELNCWGREEWLHLEHQQPEKMVN